MDEYNKQQEQNAQWVRGKLMIRQAEQAREVARYYQHKNLTLQPGSLVWLNKRASNRQDGDLLVARKLALQWSGPFIYLRTVNNSLGEIARQDKGQQTGKPMRHGCTSVAQERLDAYRRFLSHVTIFPVPARLVCADNAPRA